ncbi:radical SAM protein [Micromonospora sp. CPCC 205556]
MDTTVAALGRFNEMSGRLRVSVTHACQLRCKFCHQEGISDHWQPIHMDPVVFGRVVDAFCALGGKEIDVTGGDPLVHPRIIEVLEHLADRNIHRALCTNGLLLHRVRKPLEQGYIDEIKLSVHASSDSVGKELLGAAWSEKQMDAMLGLARDVGVAVTINFSVTSENVQEFEMVLQKSLAMRTNLLVIDLIGTRWDLQQRGLRETSTNAIVSRIAALAEPAGVVHDRTGCRMTRFTSPTGNLWMVKDVRNGLLFTGMCNGCQLKQRCGEGVFVLRIDSRGTFRPCLIRPDLEVRHNIGSYGPETMRDAMAQSLTGMMAEPCRVEAGVSLYG